MEELLVFSNNWLESDCDGLFGVVEDWCFDADWNRDGRVDLFDFAMMATQTEKPTGLIVLWKFDETDGAWAYDSSGNGHHGRLRGGATFVSGKIGNALQLDGSTGRMAPPNALMNGVKEQVTIAFWAKGGSVFPRNGFVLGTNTTFSLYLPWGQSVIWDAPHGNRLSKIISVLDYKEVWTHWAFVRNNQTGTSKIYMNGKAWHSGLKRTLSWGIINEIRIGSNISETTFFQGTLDDFRIYNTELTAVEIDRLYKGVLEQAYNPQPADHAYHARAVDRDLTLAWSAGNGAISHHVYLGTTRAAVENATPHSVEFKGNYATTYFDTERLRVNTRYYWRIDAVSPSGTAIGNVWSFDTRLTPIAGWRFDETSGTTLSDSAGDHHGLISGTPQWRSGRFKGSLYFDGSSNYVSIPKTVLDGVDNEITVSLWMYGDSFQSGENVIFHAPTADGWFSVKIPHAEGRVHWEAPYPDSISKPALEGQYKYKWNHWAFTKNRINGQQRIYYNGILWLSENGKTGTIGPLTSDLTIGASQVDSSYANFYKGAMDDFRIYDKALNEDEIKRISTVVDITADVNAVVQNHAPNNEILGMGWNMIPFYMPPQGPHRDEFLQHFVDTHQSYVRLMMISSTPGGGTHYPDWEVQNDDDNPWTSPVDFLNNPNNKFAWNQGGLPAWFIAVLDACEANDIDVEINGVSVWGKSWLRTDYFDSASYPISYADYLADAEEAGENLAALIYYLKTTANNGQGYSCIKYYALGNEYSEPQVKVDIPGSMNLLHKQVHDHLVYYDQIMGTAVRNTVSCIGLEAFPFYRPNPNRAPGGNTWNEMIGKGFIQYLEEPSSYPWPDGGPYMDMISIHNYWGVFDYDRHNPIPHKHGTLQSHLLNEQVIPTMNQIVQYNNGGPVQPLLVNELGCFGYCPDVWIRPTYDMSLYIAEASIRLFQQGVAGISRWNFNAHDAYAAISYPGAWWESSPGDTVHVVAENYYPYTLLTSTIQKGMQVLPTTVFGSSDNSHGPETWPIETAQRVWASIFRNSQGTFVIAVVNDSYWEKKVAIHIDDAITDVDKLYVTEDAYDQLYRCDAPSVMDKVIYDTVPPRSITVYKSM